MNVLDRVWYFEPGPRGPIRRPAMVVAIPDGGGAPAVNLCVWATCRTDPRAPCWIEVAVPVNPDHIDGMPVARALCVSMSAKPKLAGGLAPVQKPARIRQ